MAKKLFKTAEELLNGYEELNLKGGRKVYLRGRALKTGNVSLYLYSNDILSQVGLCISYIC